MVGYLRRYIDFYQGLKGPPDTEKEGSAREWFYFRLIHQMRVRWENEQHKKEANKGGGSQPEQASSRPREAPKKRAEPERAQEEGREMTQAEKIAEAQERLGIEPHEPAQTLTRKPKGFKSTRVKRTKR